MTLSIKICGLKTPEAVDRAVDLGATHLGFIFFEKSPRNIHADEAARLADRVRSRAKIVAVTVDADNEELDDIIQTLNPDVLQFHGHESASHLLTIKSIYGLDVIKALSISQSDDLRKADAYIGIADRFLFDAKAPKGSDLPGGNGIVFDWTIMNALDSQIDYFLSGGLTSDNVGKALEMTHVTGLDVSSGVESFPGVKDLGMMDAFFASVRAAESQRRISGSEM